MVGPRKGCTIRSILPPYESNGRVLLCDVMLGGKYNTSRLFPIFISHALSKYRSTQKKCLSRRSKVPTSFTSLLETEFGLTYPFGRRRWTIHSIDYSSSAGHNIRRIDRKWIKCWVTLRGELLSLVLLIIWRWYLIDLPLPCIDVEAVLLCSVRLLYHLKIQIYPFEFGSHFSRLIRVCIGQNPIDGVWHPRNRSI